MIGQRIYGDDVRAHELTAGQYGHRGPNWYGVTPNGLIANLLKHTVTEHEDGTITVSPSILVERGPGGERWHGSLERGVWLDD